MSEIRSTALQYAVEITGVHNGSGASLDEVLTTARKIEAYLTGGNDLKASWNGTDPLDLPAAHRISS